MSLLNMIALISLSAILGGAVTWMYLDYQNWSYARQAHADRLTGSPIGAQLAREMNINLPE
jgi:hypothetical protein